jgi:hypothetical protein
MHNESRVFHSMLVRCRLESCFLRAYMHEYVCDKAQTFNLALPIVHGEALDIKNLLRYAAYISLMRRQYALLRFSQVADSLLVSI